MDHPRIRGEHRPAPPAPVRGGGSSPHTRGALTRPSPARSPGRDHPRIRGEHISAFGVWPGGVGSSPHTRGARSPPEPRPGPPPDHPRIRGEHPTTTSPWPWRSGSSPHTRGALSRGGGLAGRCRIIPAYAGSTVDCVVVGFPEWDHPRIRGEHAGAGGAGAAGVGSSPHTRGAPRGASGGGCRAWIIPAYAGSTSVWPDAEWPKTDHPRIRGEHLLTPLGRQVHQGSSPHTRGALGIEAREQSFPGIIPAYAGSTVLLLARDCYVSDHPRIRGEHLKAREMTVLTEGSSPHTRGAQRDPGLVDGVRRIIPAYAGSTLWGLSIGSVRGDHPRIRGEHLASNRVVWCCFGIIPAYAGSTLPQRFFPRLGADHPRIRGEHFEWIGNAIKNVGSSPHTRGAPDARRRRHHRRRIIPAYAGSTRPTSPPRRRRKDHPRIRGEHIKISVTADTKRGSSPHTRGARVP